MRLYSFFTTKYTKYTNGRRELGRLAGLVAMGNLATGQARRMTSAAARQARPGFPGTRFRPFDYVFSVSLHMPVIAWKRGMTYPSVGSIGSIVLFSRTMPSRTSPWATPWEASPTGHLERSRRDSIYRSSGTDEAAPMASKASFGVVPRALSRLRYASARQAAGLFCANGQHESTDKDIIASGHWDMDELLDLMEWTRRRVGPHSQCARFTSSHQPGRGRIYGLGDRGRRTGGGGGHPVDPR